MSTTTLTREEAAQASIPLLENKRGTQALHDLIVALRANRRSGTANTKSRAEVSGSGKKLWRQKGTGRARMGSVRSPVWVGGGVVFGPKPRDYSKKVTKKTRRLAFLRALTDIIDDGIVTLTDSFEVADGKTKTFLATVRQLAPEGSVMLVGDSFSEATYLAGRNAQEILMIQAASVNVEQLLSFKHVIVVGSALQTLAQRAA
jgi:large subunit ribosomal protein L4